MIDTEILQKLNAPAKQERLANLAAVYAARMEGLCTAGIIDHDSISGAEEFLEAAKLIDMPVTIGMECRVSMEGTRLAGLRTNNPDQVGVSYMMIQSVPHHRIERLTAFSALTVRHAMCVTARWWKESMRSCRRWSCPMNGMCVLCRRRQRKAASPSGI